MTQEELRAGTGCWGRTKHNRISLMRRNMDIVLEGWLTKSPPEKLWKAKWRRRYFILRHSGELPNQYLLEYYTDQHCNKLKGRVDLDQCEQVDAGLHGANAKFSYNHLFDIKTPKRVYYLAAETESEMTRWVDCICHVCGLKPYNKEEEYYDMPPVMRSETPATATTTTTALAESQLAPVTTQPESPVTGPYIPLNQCLSRVPERSPTTPGRDSVFTDDETAIPPVNWDTFPRGNSDSSGPGDDLLLRPPTRPPKRPGLVAHSYPNVEGAESETMYGNTRHGYSNTTTPERLKASPKQGDEIFRYDFAPGTSPSIEPGLGSSSGKSPVSAEMQNGIAGAQPPPANRDRKPGKSARTPPPQSPGAPVIDRNLKPARPEQMKAFNLGPAPARFRQRAAPSPIPSLPEAPHPPTHNPDYHKIQYVDPWFSDGEGASGSSPHNSPGHPGHTEQKTIYNTIDLLKTQALVSVKRAKEESYRKGGHE